MNNIIFLFETFNPNKRTKDDMDITVKEDGTVVVE